MQSRADGGLSRRGYSRPAPSAIPCRVLPGVAFLIAVSISGCTQAAENCPSAEPVDLSQAKEYAADDRFPFRFPLADTTVLSWARPFMTYFATHDMTTRGPENHAAEDILGPAGMPVYAMADGRVSYSGTMGGYGWLVIVDHPQASLYSLYGHLSPSRWQIETGPVKKGQLLGHLGDPDENGGTAEHPMRPHLHFAVRAGQRADYPGMGQWRWQAGWIRPCPQDLGWLQPSVVVTGQDLQRFAARGPAGGLFEKWWFEILFGGIYVFVGACMLVVAVRKAKPLLLVLAAAVALVAGWVWFERTSLLGCVLLAMAVVFVGFAIALLVRRSTTSGTS